MKLIKRFKLFPNLAIEQVSENHIGVFHPLSLEAAYFSRDTYALLTFFEAPRLLTYARRKFSCLKDIDALLDMLIKKRVLVEEDYGYEEEIDSIGKRVILQMSRARLRSGTFVITERCNLNCGYCIVNNQMPQGHKRMQMSLETARDSALFFMRNAYSAKDSNGASKVRVFGGEPFLNFRALELITWIIRKCGLRFKPEERPMIALATNATLMTREIAQFLVRNRIIVGISLDGTGQAHDLQRKDIEGVGSFKNVLHGYRILKREGGSPSLICTVGTHNMRALPEIADFFATKLKARAVRFSLPNSPYPMMRDYAVSNGGYNKNLPTAIMDELSFSLIKAFEILRGYGIYEAEIGAHFNRNGTLRFRPYYCGSGRISLVFSPYGEIGRCFFWYSPRKYFFANLYKYKNIRDITQSPTMKSWQNRTPFTMKGCLFCPAISICGGGCAYQAEVTTGDFFGKDKLRCVFYKHFLSWYLKDRYKCLQKNKEGFF